MADRRELRSVDCARSLSILRLPSDDERVLRCVLSIQSQCHAVMTSAVSRRFMPDFSDDSTAIERTAQHIAEFSLGGIRSLKTA